MSQEARMFKRFYITAFCLMLLAMYHIEALWLLAVPVFMSVGVVFLSAVLMRASYKKRHAFLAFSLVFILGATTMQFYPEFMNQGTAEYSMQSVFTMLGVLYFGSALFFEGLQSGAAQVSVDDGTLKIKFRKRRVFMHIGGKIIQHHDIPYTYQSTSLRRFEQMVHPEDLPMFHDVLNDQREESCFFRLRFEKARHYTLFRFQKIKRCASGYLIKARMLHASSNENKNEEALGGFSEDDKKMRLNNGPYNRETLIKTLRTCEEERTMLLSVSVNSFSTFSDYYGEKESEQLLFDLVQRLACLDNDEAGIYRLSEATFAVLFKDAKLGDARIDDVLRQISTMLKTTLKCASQTIDVRLNSGYALYPDDVGRAVELIDASSLAMRKSTESATPRVVRYLPSMREEIEYNIHMAERLREALKQDQIDVHFQEVRDVETGAPAYLEQLARWKDDVLGVLRPETFLAVAKEANILDRLERYLIDRSIKKFSMAREQDSYHDVALSLNLMPSTLLNPDYIAYIKKRVVDYGLSTADVVIEVSEKTFVYNLEACIERIAAYRSEGFHVALDDFGKEYSSLSILEHVDFDIIKIDALFTERIVQMENQEIIKMLTRITHLSEKAPIAEGVENRAQSETLRRLGCHLQQGFYFHRPSRL